MNITDFVTRQEFEVFKQKAKKREEFKFKRTKKVSDGTLEISIDGEFISRDLAKSVWNGEIYIVDFDRVYHRTNNIGGCGHAVSASEFEKMKYEDFVDDFEGRCTDFFPDNYVFFNEMAEQLTLF